MENISIGNFAFTTRESGNYLACFWVGHSERAGGDVSVNLDWKTGIAAKDWDSVAKKEKIEVIKHFININNLLTCLMFSSRIFLVLPHKSYTITDT